VVVGEEAMINYDGKFEFASAPKTGVSWFLRAAQLAVLGPGFYQHATVPFPDGKSDLLRVSLVRHPVEWLIAAYNCEPRCNGIGPFLRRDGAYGQEVFEEYLRRYLRERPGSVGEMMLRYKADSYMRTEDMPDAFVELARSVGMPKELLSNRLFRVRPTVSQRHSMLVEAMDRNVRRRIIEAESEFCIRFDYF